MKTLKPFFTIPSILAMLLIIIMSHSAMSAPIPNSNMDGKRQYSYNDNFSSYDVQVKGDIKLNGDDTGIEHISAYGYLKISKKTFGNKRSIVIESDGNSKLTYEYYEGRKEIPFEEEGRKWLADVLLDVVRLTGIDVDGRVARIYKKNGVTGVINEIQAIPSNSIMALYFEALLDTYPLTEKEVVETCTAIHREMSSNTQSGRLYRKYSNHFMLNNHTATNYFYSISKLSSNTERESILRHIDVPIDFTDPQVVEAYFSGIDRMTSNTSIGSVLRKVNTSQELTDQAYVRLLQSVKKLSSNTEMGSVMRSLSTLNINNDAIENAYFNAIDGMSSNTEAGSTMRYLVKQYDLSNENYIRLLSSVKKLSSNTEMGSTLRSLQKLDFRNSALVDAYFLAVNSLSSNTEAGSVMRNAIKNYPLDTYAWTSLFNATSKLTSNTEMGMVLSPAIETMPFEDSILDAFFASTDHFSSSTEHGRILRKIAKSDLLNAYAVNGILRSARKISSNTEKSSVLMLLTETPFIADETTKENFMATARTLSSDTDYRRVIDKLIE